LNRQRRRLKREALLAAAALDFQLQDHSGLGGNWQHQIEQLIADLHLGAAVWCGAEDFGGDDLPGLQGQRLKGAAARGGDQRWKLRGNRHGAPAPPPPHAAC
jgi:hypothetical protein